MENFNEDSLEKFIRENRDKFDVLDAPEKHEETFISKLNARIRHYISIVPYLIKVAIVTVVIFTASIIVWNNCIRKDRHEVTLKQKIVNIFTNERTPRI
jgi:hypothetical protein